MKPRVLVDTDVMVDYLRGHPAAVAFVTAHAARITLSPIVVAELYAGVRAGAEQATLDSVVSVLESAPITAEIARSAGLLKREFGKSHGVGLPDAVLAATAQAEQAEFCTLNVKHYPMLPGLKPPYVKR